MKAANSLVFALSFAAVARVGDADREASICARSLVPQQAGEPARNATVQRNAMRAVDARINNRRLVSSPDHSPVTEPEPGRAQCAFSMDTCERLPYSTMRGFLLSTNDAVRTLSGSHGLEANTTASVPSRVR